MPRRVLSVAAHEGVSSLDLGPLRAASFFALDVNQPRTRLDDQAPPVRADKLAPASRIHIVLKPGVTLPYRTEEGGISRNASLQFAVTAA